MSSQMFLVALSFAYFAKALSGSYMKSTITQLERRFDIPSYLIGVIDGSFEIGEWACQSPLSFCCSVYSLCVMGSLSVFGTEIWMGHRDIQAADKGFIRLRRGQSVCVSQSVSQGHKWLQAVFLLWTVRIWKYVWCNNFSIMFNLISASPGNIHGNHPEFTAFIWHVNQQQVGGPFRQNQK